MDKLFDWLDLGNQAKSFRAIEAFRRAAGPKIGARAQATGVRGSTLMVRAASAAWSLELHALEKVLIERLRATPGGEGIDSLRFSVGPLVEEESGGNVPSPEVQAARQRAAPAVDLVELLRALAQVEDRELRENLARLVTRVCTPT